MSSAGPIKTLRSGYTTGTCAAAAAQGAALALLGHSPKGVAVRLPLGETVTIPLNNRWWEKGVPCCTVIKDGGDDPDVTHGAVIGACVKTVPAKEKRKDGPLPIIIRGGRGVGLVTKPGLPVKAGEPAINPVPRKMIRRSLRDVFAQNTSSREALSRIEVTLFVPGGEQLALKTFNPRLGIIGGISILGTTGIVKPFSHQAYRETICCALDIARAVKVREIVLSTGGSSERHAKVTFARLEEEAFIQMGDYVGFALQQALSRGFRRITVSAFIGKLSKIAAGSTNTHAGHSTMDRRLFTDLGKRLRLPQELLQSFSCSLTARGILEMLLRQRSYALIDLLCRKAVEKLYHMSRQRGTIFLLLHSFKGELLWYGGKEGKRAGIG